MLKSKSASSLWCSLVATSSIDDPQRFDVISKAGACPHLVAAPTTLGSLDTRARFAVEDRRIGRSRRGDAKR